jgi:hypothetical protein
LSRFWFGKGTATIAAAGRNAAVESEKIGQKNAVAKPGKITHS